MAELTNIGLRAGHAPGGALRATASAVSWLLALLALAFAIAAVAAALNGWRPLVVLSGSMSPTFGAGDLVVVREIPAAQIRPGQIVTFARPGHRGETLTHRVVKVASAGGQGRAVVTKGDANDRSERWTIPATGTVGRYAFHLPGVGSAAHWIATPLGRTIAIWLLAAALLGQILWSVWRSSRTSEEK